MRLSQRLLDLLREQEWVKDVQPSGPQDLWLIDQDGERFRLHVEYVGAKASWS